MKEIQLQDLYIGKLDAKHEILSKVHNERFYSTFLVPYNISPERILKENDQFFIMGYKGSGKTAFLRYLSIYAEKMGIPSHFILFKSDISSSFKKTLNKFGITKSDIEEEIDYSTQTQLFVSSNTNCFDTSIKDFEPVWTWFIIDKLFELEEERNILIFQKDSEYKKLKKIMDCIEKENTGTNNQRLPILKQGNIHLKLSLKEIIDFGIGAELEASDSDNRTLKLERLSEVLIKLFRQLKPTSKKALLLFDELEVLPDNTKIQHRDILLIRDLLLTIYKINLICQSNDFPILIFASIRTEIINHPLIGGKEINKYVHDFGTELMWHRFEKESFLEHPLIAIILKRIAYSVNTEYIEDNIFRQILWEDWFPKEIQNVETNRYILNNSWYRPRDMIRILSLAAKQYPTLTKFEHRVFDGTRKEYSKDCWMEIVEELATILSFEEINNIFSILTGLPRSFTFEYYKEKFNKIRANTEHPRFFERFNEKESIDLLYRLGVLGNYLPDRDRPRYRWKFRGDPDAMIDNYKYKLMVHNALWPVFSIN